MSTENNADVLRRGPVSMLFVPANRPDRFAKAAASGASAVVLDLEDAVAAVDKAAARTTIVPGLTGVPCVWRINAIGSSAYDGDMRLLERMRPDAVMLPKAEGGPAFDAFAAGLPGVPIIALVETALGIANARPLAAHPAVVALAFGTLDFCVDVGAEHIRPVLDPMRMELVLAARLAGIAAPIDGVTADLRTPGAARADAEHARALGMGGKLAVHPAQIAEIGEAFLPSQAQLDWARRVMAAGDGVAIVDGEMVDAPVKARAARILSSTRRSARLARAGGASSTAPAR